MRTPSKLPPALAAGPFTLSEARESRVSYGQLRHRQVLHLSRGISRMDDDGELALALLARPYSRITGFSAASHATAFAIWGIPGILPGASADTIHIARQYPHATPRRTGVSGHRTHLLDGEVECLDGLWITTRSRTWLDCARKMGVDELTVAADHLVRIPREDFEGRTEPYATIDSLEALLARHRGTPGIRKARLALGQARVGSDSAPETRLRLALARSTLPEPELNVPVALSGGAVREPDFSFKEYLVAAEYDGGTHADPAQVDRDIAREEDFAGAGWLQVRVSKRHMLNEARPAVAKIRDALCARGWRPEAASVAR